MTTATAAAAPTTEAKKARKPKVDMIGPIRTELSAAYGKATMTGNFSEFVAACEKHGKTDPDRTRAVFAELTSAARSYAPPQIAAILDGIEKTLKPVPKVDGILRVGKTRHTGFLTVPLVEGLEDVGALRMHVCSPTDPHAIAAILGKGRKILVFEALTEAEFNALIASQANVVAPGPVPGQAPAQASAVARAA